MFEELFFTTNIDLGNTFLRGYLYVPRGETRTIQGVTYSNKYDKYVTYNEVVRALDKMGNLVNQNIYQLGDCECDDDNECECEGKSTFNLLGTYKRKLFVLYDWKKDGAIHIGGSGDLDLDELIVLLNEAILLVIKKLQ